MNALKRRLRPTHLPAPEPDLPFAWQDEDGESYWCDGHIEPHRMVLAAVAEHLLCTGSEETVELMFGVDLLMAHAGSTLARDHLAGLIAGVEHLWFVGDDDQRRLVTASHDGAQPVTRMRCW